MEPRASADAGRTGLAEFLRREREHILRDWQARVRSLPPARGLNQQELLNHLPHLLDRIVLMVDDIEQGEPVRSTGSAADAHAVDRLDEGYALDQVVREFTALRQSILSLWADQPHRAAGNPVLNQAIDEAVSTAVSRYAAARERTLVALDHIAAAALEAPSVAALLRSLTTVLLQTTASVDSVALYLREGTSLSLLAAVGLEEHLAGLTRVEIGSPTCAGHIASTRQPLEVRNAATDPLMDSPLREGGARAFYGVPMLQHGDVIGVAHISSRTAFEFSREDKLVFRAMVERATTAIVQRQLQDALQAERNALDAERIALDAERRRLEAVLDTIPVGVFVSDERGRLLRVNPAVRHIWGLKTPLVDSMEDYSAFKAWWVGGEPVRPEQWGLARALKTGESVHEEEMEIETFDGSRKTILNYATPIRTESGEIIGGVAVNVDVTERRRAERERAWLLEQERGLRSTAEHALAMLDALFIDAPIGLAFLDRGLSYIRINEMLAAVNGLPPGAHIGKTVRQVLPTEADRFEPLLRKVLDSGKAVTGFEYSQAPPSTPNEVREWQLNIYPVRLVSGEVVGVGAAVVEITAFKRALQTRNEVLSVASHDLKSPLAAMRLQVDAILRRTGPQNLDVEFTRNKLEKMRKQIDRVVALLEDLLDVSRLQAGRLNLELEDVDLALLVRDVATRHEEVLAGSGCELRVDGGGPVVGRWDALRLEQIVTNLLTNAAKYGAGHPIEIRVQANGDHAILTVRDHGVGIAPENQERIFERFERAGDKSAFVGTGVGLWIVRRFLEAMDGSIRVDSRPGQGATFIVELPRRTAAEQ